MKKMLISLLLMTTSAFAQLQWGSTPVTISTAGVDASSQQIAMNAAGQAVAVWVEGGVVKSDALAFGGSWSGNLATLSQSGASNPLVVIDFSGKATALWLEGDVLKTSFRLTGGSWSATPQVLSAAGASSPDIVVDVSGNIVAVWEEYGVIKSSTQLSGASWSATPDTLSSSGAYLPRVAVGANGYVVAAWQHVLASINTIYVASKTVNGSWSADASISTAGRNSVRPEVAVDVNGNALVAWFAYTPQGSFFSNVALETSYCPYNGVWEDPFSFGETGLKDPALLMLSLYFDATGDAAVAWTNSYDGSTFAVNAATLSVSGSWSPIAPLVLQNTLASAFGLTTAGNDMIIASMYYEPGLSELEIISSVSAVGTSSVYFTFPTLVTAPGPSGFPVLQAVESGGDVYVVALWLYNNGSNLVIQSNTAMMNELSPPSNLALTPQVQDFGIVSEYSNHLTWDPSPSPQTVGYRIYRNAVFLTDLAVPMTQFIDYNQNPGSPITYFVAAIDYAGLESPLISIPGP